MSQNLQNFVKFQKFQLENLVDFEKCCKTHIFLQKSEPIQPKTSNILPKFCQPTLSDVSASERRRTPPRRPSGARAHHRQRVAAHQGTVRTSAGLTLGNFCNILARRALQRATAVWVRFPRRIIRPSSLRCSPNFCEFLAQFGSFSAVCKPPSLMGLLP